MVSPPNAKTAEDIGPAAARYDYPVRIALRQAGLATSLGTNDCAFPFEPARDFLYRRATDLIEFSAGSGLAVGETEST
ncbi:MAG: hypothetical protein ABSF92_04975 [Candidatus Acidiferrales bacterium]